MYYVHTGLAYTIYYLGYLCFASRVVPQMKFAHAFLGRLYMTAMLFATAAAMVIHNTGIALGILLALVWALAGMTLGWFVIKLHQNNMLNGALAMVDTWIEAGTLGSRKLETAIAEAKQQISMAKTMGQRFKSSKSLHGILMTLSWFNIAGRIWATSVPDYFTCYTYPVYKPVNTTRYATAGMNLEGQPLKLVEQDDPRAVGAPWRRMPGAELGWAAILFTTPIVLSMIVGLTYSHFAAKSERARLVDDPDSKKPDSGLPLTERAAGG